MNKRTITKKQFDFLENELHALKAQGMVTDSDKDRILGIYTIKERASFVTILLAIGALLMGLGILTFVASNWMYLSKAIKLFVIIGCLIAVNLAGILVEKRFPKTSRSLHYAGILIFGAGIFLIEQMFNIQINFNQSFLLWATGAIVIGYHLRDIAILIFTSFLLYVYLNGSIFVDGTSYPLAIFLFLPALYILLNRHGWPKFLTFLINALAINTIALFLMEVIPKLGVAHSDTIVFCILFVIGLTLAYVSVPKEMQAITHLQGHLLHGIAGIFLSYDLSIWFSILYFLLLLYFIHLGSLTSIVIICALIFRYYLDSVGYLPSSMVFILGGILLLAFGFIFEKKRRKGSDVHDL